MTEVELIFNKLFDYFEVDTIKDLSEKLKMSQSTVSKWRQRSSIIPIKKKCREIGIYNEIFGENTTNNFQNSVNNVAQDYSNNSQSSHSINNQKIELDENILKLVDTLYGFAKSNNKVEDLKNDLSTLLTKYM